MESTKIISMISLDNFMISRNFKKSDVSLDIRHWTPEFRRCRGADVQGRLPAAGRRATSAACRQCKQTHRRRRRRLSTGGVDAYLYIPYLSWNTNQQQPLLLRVRPIVNDLAASETRVAVEHLLRLWVTCTNHRQSGRKWQSTHTCLTALCPGLPGWASTRKVKPIWILLNRQWVAAASAGLYASLHVAPDRQPRRHPTTRRWQSMQM